MHRLTWNLEDTNYNFTHLSILDTIIFGFRSSDVLIKLLYELKKFEWGGGGGLVHFIFAHMPKICFIPVPD